MSTPEVPIRAAATLMPLRDGSDGLEVCLLRRNANSTWVAGLALFPGGAVDPRDASERLVDHCVLPERGPERGLPGGLAPWIAALRECYEEIGLLLATDPEGRWAHEEPARAERLASTRRAVDAGELTLASLLAEEQLQLRVDLLRFVAHWVTPPGQSRRYDTRFYLAPAPAGAVAAPDGTEIVAADWIAPAAAISAHGVGELPMLPPTLGALHWLAPHASVAAAIAAAEAMGEIPRWTPGDEASARDAVVGGRGGDAGEVTP